MKILDLMMLNGFPRVTQPGSHPRSSDAKLHPCSLVLFESEKLE